MSSDLVLLTGATGHVGFGTLKCALEYGYQVRAAVRSEAKAETIRSNPAIKAMNRESQLEFVIVPDFTVPDAFDAAVEGVKYIIHVAAPLATRVPEDGDYHKFFVEPSMRGTMGMLESARKTNTVKRIVITSSVASIMPLPIMFGQVPAERPIDAEARLPEMEGPYPNSIVAYTAAKIAALNGAEAWHKREQPGFDLIHIFPSFVYGRDDLCTSSQAFATSTNRMPVGVVTGMSGPNDPQGMVAMPDIYNHIDDCARVHVMALDPKVEGNQGFIVSNNGSDGMKWEDTQEIAAKHFPEAVKSGILPSNGVLDTVCVKLDNSKTEKTFGFKHASFEDMVVSAIGHYLELLEKERNHVN